MCVSIKSNMLTKEMFPMVLVLSKTCTIAAHDYCLLQLPPIHLLSPFLSDTSQPVNQCPIHAPSTCTMGLDPCARHSLFGRKNPYYTVIFYSSCVL